MNSEELELSLQTEFESYLKGFLAELRQEVSEFQKSFEAEFEKHKAQTDEALHKLVGRFDAGVTFDQAFNESVIEHLRLARDEGATITAVAIGEAEKLKEESAPAEFDKLRDAINEISSKASQSEILKSLVDHAAYFAPRGAFFIVKNEHFVGWRAFGDESRVDENTVRAIQFPMSSDTVLAQAISGQRTAAAGSGSHADDEQFLTALDFGNPDRMYAIPLVARGRGVAVLYADYGSEGVTLNPEALETLVRVAGLTVELAAAAVQPAALPQQVESPAIEKAPEPEYHAPAAPVEERAFEEAPEAEVETAADEYRGVQEFEHADVVAPAYEETPAEPDVQEVQRETGFATVTDETFGPETVEERSFETVVDPAVREESPVPVEAVEERSFETFVEPVVQEEAQVPVEAVEEHVPVERFGEHIVEEVQEVTYFEPVDEQPVAVEPTFVQPEPVEEYVPAEAVEEFPEVIEEPEPAPAPVAQYVPQPEPQVVETFSGSPAPAVREPVVEVASAQVSRTKYRDRNVDLPIEVPEEERRLHNDARRFARLLVSEIKLYNEQKVSDGRQSGDLYDRLREAIDRSRDMYDKRVQQPVADKFDYFHFELVNSLAEGEDVKLGASYPGSRVAV